MLSVVRSVLISTVNRYSLSDAPNGEYFRISVKREDGVPVPTLSNPEVPFHPGWHVISSSVSS